MILRGLEEINRKNDLRVEGFVLARFASYTAFFRFRAAQGHSSLRILSMKESEKRQALSRDVHGRMYSAMEIYVFKAFKSSTWAS
jgi:hypothetical protein